MLREHTMRNETYRQYALESGDSRVTCWLRWTGLRPGAVVTLKGDDRRWTVREAYATTRDLPPDREWNVGGMAGTGR